MWESVSVKRIIKGSHKRVSKHKGEVRTYEGRRQGRVTCFSLRCQTDRAPINTQTKEVHPRNQSTLAIVSPPHRNVQRAPGLTLEFLQNISVWSAMGHLIGRRVLSRAEWPDIGGSRRASTPIEICIGLQPLAALQGQ
jgi:hypothetical protein